MCFSRTSEKGWGGGGEKEEEVDIEDAHVSGTDRDMSLILSICHVSFFQSSGQNLPHFVPFRYSEVPLWSQVGRLQPALGLVALTHRQNKQKRGKN